MHVEGIRHHMKSIREWLPPSKCSFHVCSIKLLDFIKYKCSDSVMQCIKNDAYKLTLSVLLHSLFHLLLIFVFCILYIFFFYGSWPIYGRIYLKS